MSQEIDKRDYDIASISQHGKDKRANHIQHALYIEKSRIHQPGNFVKVFADMFLKRETSNKSYI